MGSKKFLFALLLAFLLAVICASASSNFKVIANNTYTDIFQDEAAIFNFTIYNNLDSNQRFFIKFGSEVDWIIDTVPAEDYYPMVYGEGSRVVTVSIRPKVYMPVGRYRVGVTVQNTQTDELKTIDFDVLVKPLEWKKLLPSVQVILNMDNDIDPRMGTLINVELRNLNRLNLTNLKVTLGSKVINEERLVNMLGLDKKSVAFLVKLNSLQEPIKDTLTATASIVYENKSYSFDIAEQYKIISYADLIQNSAFEKSFLRKTEIISLKNDGNVRKDFEIVRKQPFLRKLFISTTPKAGLLKTEEGSFYYWKIPLDPQESTTIQVREGYRSIVALVVLALIAIILYYIMRSPITVRKQVSQIGTSEGGISELKIILHLKSRTKKAIDGIIVLEKIPHIAEMGDEFQAGTIRPTKLINTRKKGTLIKWEIPNLEPYEERIITYKLKSRLSIIGGIVLLPCLVKFKTTNGKEVRTRSNRVTLEI